MTVSINEANGENDGTDDIKPNSKMVCGTMSPNLVQEKLKQHIMRDDLLLLNSEEKTKSRDSFPLDVKRDGSFLESVDQPAFDCGTDILEYAPISNEVILEESSSSFDEGIGLSNTDDSSDDQASAKSESITVSKAFEILPAQGFPRNKSKDKLKSYQCEICQQCGRTFAYKNSYQRHTLIHRDEAQHQCTGCGKQFSKLSHLTFHRKSHGCARKVERATGEGVRASKNLTCDICNSIFERDDTLLAHRNEQHSSEDHVREKGRCRYKCVICSKSFQEEKELRTHFKLHEADDCPFQCGMCGILNLTHA
uniref:C2H2-type domain-containing protein n=1 Tax=Anopheles epiroticus TaxID=199890 RepID=A0A182PNG6_9DIPT